MDGSAAVNADGVKLDAAQVRQQLPDLRIGMRVVTLTNRTLSRLAERFIECTKAVSDSLTSEQ